LTAQHSRAEPGAPVRSRGRWPGPGRDLEQERRHRYAPSGLPASGGPGPRARAILSSYDW